MYVYNNHYYSWNKHRIYIYIYIIKNIYMLFFWRTFLLQTNCICMYLPTQVDYIKIYIEQNMELLLSFPGRRMPKSATNDVMDFWKKHTQLSMLMLMDVCQIDSGCCSMFTLILWISMVFQFLEKKHVLHSCYGSPTYAVPVLEHSYLHNSCKNVSRSNQVQDWWLPMKKGNCHWGICLEYAMSIPVL